MTALDTAIPLSDGSEIPQLGLGVYKTPNDVVASVVRSAVELGYRHIDTAAMYGNESGVGDGIAQSSVPRDELYITTKVQNGDHGFDETLEACRRSLDLLGTDYVDLYLIHWPAPRQNRFVETWHALEQLQREGLARSIGVSNFHTHHLQRLIDESDTVPVINQVECHPWLPQDALIDFHAEHSIATEAWSPLARGQILSEPALIDIGRQLAKTPAQIVLRWHIERGLVVIPKSVHPDRVAENADLDFELTPHFHEVIAGLATHTRVGIDPDDRD